MTVNVNELVTNRILELLKEGTIPWKSPWISRGSHISVNWKTQKPYRGINQMLLPFGGEYATFNQIREAGGRVKKGEKGHIVVLWKPCKTKVKQEDIEAQEDENTTEKTYLLLRYYRVFEINTQCEGLESKRPKLPVFDHDPVAEGEAIVQGFVGGPEIRFAPGRAYYKPFFDYVSVPPLSDYPNPHEYYSTLFHELVHSTGHESRLNRDGITKSRGFGSDPYAFEELVAEMGAAMLCAHAGIDNSTIENSAAYIDNWLTVLRNDTKLVIKAASHAQKAVDLILGTQFKEEGNTNDSDAA